MNPYKLLKTAINIKIIASTALFLINPLIASLNTIVKYIVIIGNIHIMYLNSTNGAIFEITKIYVITGIINILVYCPLNFFKLYINVTQIKTIIKYPMYILFILKALNSNFKYSFNLSM
ncbi:hypothetical protein D3C76_1107270 [compost metagenome]